MGWLDRVSTKDYQLTETCTIPAGMPVYVNVVGIQMDPQYFPDPDKYDPERFMNEKNIKSYTFMPFGEGPRICIGEYHIILHVQSFQSGRGKTPEIASTNNDIYQNFLNSYYDWNSARSVPDSC